MKKFDTGKLHVSAVFIVIIAIVIVWVVWSLLLKSGELFSPDFRKGYEMYVEEGYTRLSNFEQGVGFDFEIEPHFIWRLTDEDVKSEIYSLCRGAKHYRTFQGERDVMLGTPPIFVYLPAIYINTGDYGYRISILNWEIYSGSAWRYFPIKNEKYGEPVLLIARLELSEENLRDDQTELDYIKSSNRGLNGYSIMAQKSLDSLLAILENIGDDIAEVEVSFP